MSRETLIPWCHATFNPWTGCSRVSPGCEHCYAEALVPRMQEILTGSADRLLPPARGTR